MRKSRLEMYGRRWLGLFSERTWILLQKWFFSLHCGVLTVGNERCAYPVVGANFGLTA